MMRSAALPLLLLLAACGGAGGKAPQGTPPPVQDGVELSYQGWNLGPIIKGTNYSPGAVKQAGGVVSVHVPPGAELDAMIHPVSSLKGELTFDYTVTGTFYQVEHPENPGLMSVMFQRKGDDWYAKNGTEWHRWYSLDTFTLAPGDHSGSVSFDDLSQWISVWGQPAASNAAQYNEAKDHVANLQFVFGGPGGRGHGVASVDGATFTLTSVAVK